jgi:hypothetical protein
VIEATTRPPSVRTAATIVEMQQTNPLARVVELPGIGHAPWLMSSDQIGIVRDFLTSPALP